MTDTDNVAAEENTKLVGEESDRGYEPVRDKKESNGGYEPVRDKKDTVDGDGVELQSPISPIPKPSMAISHSPSMAEEKFDEDRGSTKSGFLENVLPPDIFPGVKRCETKLVYIDNPSSATLKTKLATLGNAGFRFIPAIWPYSLGRAVLGWDIFWIPKKFWQRLRTSAAQRKEPLCQGSRETELVLLPHILSKGYAYINVYVRIMLTVLLLISILGFVYASLGLGVTQAQLDACQKSAGSLASGYYSDDAAGGTASNDEIEAYCSDTLAQQKSFNPGIAWAVGTSIALACLWLIGSYTASAVGTLPFLRAMGRPEVEEYMFSYSWSCEADNIRTLGKAMWENEVGCWIDVVKLNSGDAIRPVVRTMMNRVYRCVVFLSKPYLGSPNCCVEIQEAIKHPEKVTFCLLQDIPEVMPYLEWLQKEHKGVKICRGISELIPILSKEISTPDDLAYQWWKKQQITISGAPEQLLAKKPIPMFSLALKRRPLTSLYVGPLYISGDCLDQGRSFLPPWLFILWLFGVGFNFLDIFRTLHNTKKKRAGWVYVWLACIVLLIIAPVFALKQLLDTRYWMHPVLKPLLASASLQAPIRVIVKGNKDDPICRSLRNFVQSIGHGCAPEFVEYQDSDTPELKLMKDHITVLVIDSIATRDRWLAADEAQLGEIMQNSVVVYSNTDNPFGDGTPIAQKLMRYLVLSRNDCKDTLAENIFSGIAIRAVKYLHHGHEKLRENA